MSKASVGSSDSRFDEARLLRINVGTPHVFVGVDVVFVVLLGIVTPVEADSAVVRCITGPTEGVGVDVVVCAVCLSRAVEAAVVLSVTHSRLHHDPLPGVCWRLDHCRIWLHSCQGSVNRLSSFSVECYLSLPACNVTSVYQGASNRYDPSIAIPRGNSREGPRIRKALAFAKSSANISSSRGGQTELPSYISHSNNLSCHNSSPSTFTCTVLHPSRAMTCRRTPSMVYTNQPRHRQEEAKGKDGQLLVQPIAR